MWVINKEKKSVHMRTAQLTLFSLHNLVAGSNSLSTLVRRCSHDGIGPAQLDSDDIGTAADGSSVLSHEGVSDDQHRNESDGERRGTSSTAATAGSSRRLQSPLQEFRGPSWQRRKSDAATPKEIMMFQRDHKYAKKRPLPTLPWLQLAEKTYLDDAERIYGRLRHWEARYGDQPERVEELKHILRQAMRDLRRQVAVERRFALRYQRLCEQHQAEYRSFLIAGLSKPSLLRNYATESLEKITRGARKGSNHSNHRANDDTQNDNGSGENNNIDAENEGDTTATVMTEEREQRRLAWRLRGANARLSAESVALKDLSERDASTVPSYSSYPFLRKRAQDQANTLDPSLVDWSAKYFPHDDDHTLDLPPSLASRTAATVETLPPESASASVAKTGRGGAGGGEATSSVPPASGSNRRRPKQRFVGRRSLRLPLRSHRNATMATFDGEGVFFPVKEPSTAEDEDGDRSSAAKAPKPITPDTFFRPHAPARQRKVVKVDYDTVLLARQTRKSPEVHRARERLIRLTRGEPIETI